jgi:hypothetical protein
MSNVGRRLQVLEKAHGVCPRCGRGSEVERPRVESDILADLAPYAEAIRQLVAGELGLPREEEGGPCEA